MIYARVTHNQRPSYHDVIIYQGATFSDTVTIRNTDGTPFDLTNFNGRGRISKVEQSESDIILSVAITDATNGILTISLSSEQTADIRTINGAQTWSVYDVEIFDSSTPPTVHRVVQGQVLIEPEITT